MRIVLVHEYYQHSGGEDQVFKAERQLLEDNGHEVLTFTESNRKIPEMGVFELLRACHWNSASASRFSRLLETTQPDAVHFHNTFPLLSPSVYVVADRARVPTVQTLHNYRLMCLNSLFLRNGSPCQDCMGKVAWRGVLHACYRGSRLASAVALSSSLTHRALRTWALRVHAFIVFTSFAKDQFIANGLLPDRLHIKPNFLADDPGVGSGRGGYALFLGRLSEEKGVLELLKTWHRMDLSAPVLKIAGDGPLSDTVADSARRHPRIEYLGRVERERANQLLEAAGLLLLPSICFEGMPLAAIEAMAAGVPIVASALGGLAEIVHADLGCLVPPNNATELANAVQRVMGDHALRARLGSGARREYLERYTAEANLDRLMEVYDAARSTAGRKSGEARD